MNDLLPLARPRSNGGPVHIRYESAGLSLYGPPIPWNAAAIVVEVALRLPPRARTRTDYSLRFPGHEPILAETIKNDPADDKLFRVFFRLPTPSASSMAEVLWRQRLITSVAIPVQTADHFLSEMRITTPTVSVKFGPSAIGATTFVASQCKGVIAAAVLRSPTGLAPLAELGVSVSFRSERTKIEHTVAVPLTASQLGSREALLTASPPKFPKQAGEYTVTWRAAGRAIASQRLMAMTASRFTQSLRVVDAYFLLATEPGGKVQPVRNPPIAGGPMSLAPVFVLASREPGAAGLVDLEVTGTSPEPNALPFVRQAVLVTDGPTTFSPGMLDAKDIATLSGFDVRHNGKVIGSLSFRPVPTASFNAEGGFKPPPEFAWSNTAEEELAERLMKLMKPDG